MEIIKIDKKSKIFFLVFLMLLLIATYFTYRRTIILHNYPVDYSTEEDTATESSTNQAQNSSLSEMVDYQITE